ncbi:unnamed protein product [Penicillium discolor]
MKHRNLARHEAARQAAKKTKAGGKGKAPEVGAAKTGVPVPTAAGGNNKGKGKAVAGPSTPSKGAKKRAAEEFSAEKEKTPKRKIEQPTNEPTNFVPVITNYGLREHNHRFSSIIQSTSPQTGHIPDSATMAQNRIPVPDDYQLELLAVLRERRTIKAHRLEFIRGQATSIIRTACLVVARYSRDYRGPPR